MKFLFLPLALFLGCATAEKDKSLSDSLNLEVKELKLENGLTALIVANPKLPIFSQYFFYKVGGKNEIPGITGASHFLEHMMFKGAKKYGKNTIDFMIEGSGGNTNAYTTNDQTVYYVNLPVSELESILDIEADRMENLLLDKDDFAKEREVVLEERKMRYENSPRGQLYLGLMENLFQGTPYGTSVIGDVDDLRTVTRDQIQAYFKRFYAPNNAVLVIVGNVNVRETEELIKRKFAAIPRSPRVEEDHRSLKDEAFAAKLPESRVIELRGESPNPLFMLGFPTYKAGDPRNYALDVLSSVIGSGKSSALVNTYVYIEQPVATSIYAAHSNLEKAGVFFVGGELLKGVKLDAFREDLQKNLLRYCETEVTPRSVQKVKNNFQVDLYSGLDSNSGLAQFLGERQLLFGDWRIYKQELAEYERVSVEEVKNACGELFRQPNLFISVWNQHPKLESKPKGKK